jgi:hypothetical protein
VAAKCAAGGKISLDADCTDRISHAKAQYHR